VDSDSPSYAPAGHALPWGLTRRMLEAEICLVFALSLGRSGIYALVDLIASATSPGRLSNQTAVLNGSLSPGRPWLDLTLQLLAIGFGLVPCLLVVHLLHRSGESMRAIGFDTSTPGRDLFRGVALAGIIGGIGLGFYLLTFALGVDLTVVAENLPDVWWRIPVLVLSALENALLEELVVVGYLVRRLGQLGWGPRSSVVCSAVVRGTYHLYQGLGGFFGNLAMGVLFGWLYTRWGRVTPLVIAHFLLDVGAFVGYALLAGHVSWLPS
jgi:membrane protease YdiL (CAAX protease family)